MHGAVMVLTLLIDQQNRNTDSNPGYLFGMRLKRYTA